MHTLLILVSLALALAGCLVCMGLLRMAHSLTSRRALQLAGMLIPLFVLGLLVAVMGHFISEACFVVAPPTDRLIAQAVSLIGALGIAVAIALNIVRAVLLPWHLRRKTWEGPEWLQTWVTELLEEMGLRRHPHVRVAVDDQPWALVAGIFRPHLVISSGLVMLLDDEELDAVLCHELTHIRRGDLWWTLLGGILRDLTWFIPVTHTLYEKLLAEQEVACDDHVTGQHRRLALASALARVWQAELNLEPSPHGALALFSPEHVSGYEARVRRLMEQAGVDETSNWVKAIVVIGVVLALFVPVQLAAAELAMDEMGCQMYPVLSAVIR